MISVGIDVHKNRCVAALKMNDSRQVLEEITFENNTKGIDDFVKRIKEGYGTQNIRAVCESTANYWMRLYDTLEDRGIDTVLAHPAKTRIIAEAKIKTDRIDSAILADLLRTDMICESFVPDKQYRDLRNLVRTRLGLVHNRTHVQNKVHSILAKYDYEPPVRKTFSDKGIKWLYEITLSEIDRMTMNAYLDEINLLQKQIDTFESKIAQISKDDRRARLLMTISGIS